MSQYPPNPGQYPQDDSPGPHDPHRGSTPGIAVASLIFGIIAIVLSPLLIFGVIALVLGLVAVGKTGAPSGRPGRGFAIAGVALGGSSLVLGLIMALLIAILLPALGAARRTARRMQNSTQLVGLHQGMLTYANNNKNHYPGLNSNGYILADGADTGNSGDGNTPQARYWILLDGQFFTPEYAISPSETDPRILSYAGSGPVQADAYSYAMLGFEKGAPVAGLASYHIPASSAGRAAEWMQTINPNAIIVSDRNTGTNADTMVQSIHTDRPGDWKGSILWNDNHVGFEDSHIVMGTKYGNGQTVSQDNLFEDETPNGTNALMVHDRP